MSDLERKPERGKTNWEQIDSLTEEEIRAAAISDPDAQPLTDEQLARMKSVLVTSSDTNETCTIRFANGHTWHLPLSTVPGRGSRAVHLRTEFSRAFFRPKGLRERLVLLWRGWRPFVSPVCGRVWGVWSKPCPGFVRYKREE